ncbi:thiolase family protein [Amycolatopsis sp. NPDC098790]|uniref:thiolase family protein n=1 Tax=Amycolatopsis sp. NPDC098790 TaxID=3363939 RepID=UPI0038070C1B
MSRDVLLLGAVRTPNGRYGGSLRETGAVELGVLAAETAIARAGIGPELVEELVLANCRQAGNGPNPGRQVALRAKLPQETPAQTINMACASGLKAIQLARQSILSGDADIAIAVATESMSTMPYLAPPSLRWGGVKRGDIVLSDGWRDGGTDPVCGLNMGQTAENIASWYDVSREAQDAWSLRSHQRVATAWAEGRFAGQVVDVPLKDGFLDRDEGFRTDTTAERLAKLKPSFLDGGTVTAGNASQMADGAAAIVLASADAVAAHGLTPLGRMRSFSAVGVDPTVMGVGPAYAIPRALEKAGVKSTDLDLVEINEAFAAQVVHNVRVLELDEDRVNVNGGGIALGHPTGQSGCRLVVSLLHELARRDATLGVASLCVGGGQGVAAVIERVA